MRAAEGWEPRPATSREYVWVTITAEAASGEPIDPTSDSVAFSIVAEDTPPATFTGGIWRTITEDAHGNTLEEPEYQAGILVGAGGTIVLAAGHYDVYVKVTDSPEVPVRKVRKTLIID